MEAGTKWKRTYLNPLSFSSSGRFAVKNTLLRYLQPGKDLGRQYVSEVIKAARAELCGRKEDNVKLLPTLARLLKEGGHSTKVEFWGAEDMVRLAKDLQEKDRKDREKRNKTAAENDNPPRAGVRTTSTKTSIMSPCSCLPMQFVSGRRGGSSRI